MIDLQVFRTEWALLCERFRMTGGQEPSQLMMRRYYEYLSPRMDTEVFVAAARQVYAEREFFPRPVDFVEAAGPGEDRGAVEWEKVSKLLRNSGSPLDSLDEPARRAVRAMGGLFRIGERASELHFRRREFLEHYAAYADPGNVPALPPVSEEGRRLIRQAMSGELEQAS